MSEDHRTPNEIERDIERERAELANTVDELQDRFSPETIIREVARGFSEHGGDFGRSVRESVKQNPVALTLTGVGLAWMMFGRSYSDRDDTTVHRTVTHNRHRSYDTGETRDLYDRDDGLDRYREPRRASFTTRRYPDDSDWAYADLSDDWDDGDWDDDEDGLFDTASDAASSAASGVGRAAGTVGDSARSAAGAVGSGARSAAGAVGSGARSASGAVRSGASSIADAVGRAADGASDAGNAAMARAARMRDRLAEGTENMSDAARDRIVNARARFLDARRRADEAARRNLRRSQDAVGDFIEEQPLVAGALAMAVGAALAGALPRTQREDEMFGAKSDELYDEAERVFRRERAKLRDVANATMDEARDIANEKRADMDAAAPGNRSAVGAAADELRDAGQRVADRARDEARKTGLGDPDA